MELDWINLPVIQYAITGVGLFASLCLWGSAKGQLRSIHAGTKKSIETLEGEIRGLSAEIAELRKAGEAAVETAPLPLGQAINLTKRAQVLRMRHRGESVNSISAALQIPSGEVNLLLKIEKLLEAEPVEAAR